MTISSETNKFQYSGDGSTTNFAYTNTIFVAADLEVTLDDTVQTITTHYTVNGAGDAGGGSIDMVTAPASGETLVIKIKPAITQATDYTAGSAFPASSHEDALDKLTLITQSLQEEVDRCFQANISRTSPNTVVPDPESNKLLGWNAAATALENVDLPSFTTSEHVVVNTIAALKAVDSSAVTDVLVTGYTARGDGKGSHYYYDASDTTSADNADTIIVGDDGARWKTAQVAGVIPLGDTTDNDDILNKGRLRFIADEEETTSFGQLEWLIRVGDNDTDGGRDVHSLQIYHNNPTVASPMQKFLTFDRNGNITLPAVDSTVEPNMQDKQLVVATDNATNSDARVRVSLVDIATNTEDAFGDFRIDGVTEDLYIMKNGKKIIFFDTASNLNSVLVASNVAGNPKICEIGSNVADGGFIQIHSASETVETSFSTNGNDNYIGQGDFGVGTKTPSKKVQAKTATTNDGFSLINTNDVEVVLIGRDSTSNGDGFINISDEAGTTKISLRGDANTSYFNGGSVAVGNTTASKKMHVKSSTANDGYGLYNGSDTLQALIAIEGYTYTAPMTVSNLPAAGTAGEGARAFVTDANATTFASVVAGSGSNNVPVYSDGSDWRIG